MRALLLAATTIALAACNHPTPPPVPYPDASDAAPGNDCVSACAALDTIGCGLPSDGGTCVAFLQTLSDSQRQMNPATSRPISCADVAGVRSKADAVRIGFVCPP